MKKILFLTLTAVMLFTLTISAVASVGDINFIKGDVVTITKSEYDKFNAVKESANNEIIAVQKGLDFVCDNKLGWYLDVKDNALKGTVKVAYKIGGDYFLVTFNINGAGKYYIGDGSGVNGVNHAKIGALSAYEKF